jgi:hypothetical protein
MPLFIVCDNTNDRKLPRWCFHQRRKECAPIGVFTNGEYAPVGVFTNREKKTLLFIVCENTNDSRGKKETPPLVFSPTGKMMPPLVFSPTKKMMPLLVFSPTKKKRPSFHRL